MLTLIPFLKKVNDPRKKSGKRHQLWLILLLVVLGLMFGYLGYRDLETFAKSNQKLIVKTFHLTIDRLPSYSTIRRAMMLVKTSELVESFNQWAGQLATPNDLTDWVSIDGKCLRSTCKNSKSFEKLKWSKITSLIKMERSGTRGEKDYEHLAYYISSLSVSAEIFASKIRGHWLIENQSLGLSSNIQTNQISFDSDSKLICNLLLATVVIFSNHQVSSRIINFSKARSTSSFV
jgi:predicted transposase YbfD/YdcC